MYRCQYFFNVQSKTEKNCSLRKTNVEEDRDDAHVAFITKQQSWVIQLVVELSHKKVCCAILVESSEPVNSCHRSNCVTHQQISLLSLQIKMLERVAYLNQMAISCLRADRHSEALTFLLAGMELSRQIWTWDFFSDVGFKQKQRRIDTFSSFASEIAPSSTPLKILMAEASNDNLMRVYARPFVLDESMVMPPSTVNVALAFNTGLVFQLRGLAKNSSADLKLTLH